MSTSKEVQLQLDSVLRILANNKCADCKRKNNPRWASYSLGMVICIQCAGIHRSLGTHITKVKSIDLDFWQPEDARKLIEMKGNDRANVKYEGKLMNLGSGVEPQEYVPRLEELKSYIKTKYDAKKWIISDSEFDAYFSGKNLYSPETISKASLQTAPLVNSEIKPVSQSHKNILESSTEKLSNLNLKPISRTSTSSSIQTPTSLGTSANNDRTELKKSILALYAKPKASKDSSGSLFSSSKETNLSLESFDYHSSTPSKSLEESNSSFESNDLFKNVWG
ncbi:hypothetical protein QEN19_001384 [Hanseniaspora menglaensis]